MIVMPVEGSRSYGGYVNEYTYQSATSEMLALEYLCWMRITLSTTSLGAGSAREWQNAVAEELLRRGYTHIYNAFFEDTEIQRH